MTNKQSYRDQIESFKANIREHLLKIDKERKKGNPYEGLIKKWLGEVEIFRMEIKKSEKRLYRKIKGKGAPNER